MATSFILNEVENAIAQVIFAHGAGADMNHEFMVEMTRLLNLESITVLRFNFPFMDKRIEMGKRYPPDRMPKLLESYLSVLSFLDTQLPIYIGGKSMGGRVAATLMNEAVSFKEGEDWISERKGGAEIEQTIMEEGEELPYA